MPSETNKVRHLVEKFCKGSGIDIGCGGDKITPSAVGVDLPNPYTSVGNDPIEIRLDIEKENLPFADKSLDFVYSSHLIEDFTDTSAILKKMIRVIKRGGYLVLVFPDQHIYENSYGGGNEHHKHAKMGLSFMRLRILEIKYKYPTKEVFVSNCDIDYNVIMALQIL